MSASTVKLTVDASDYPTFARDHRIYRYFFLAGLVILVYDHLITLGPEVKHIWLSKLRPSACWFLAVRYISLGASIVISIFYFGDLGHEGCTKLQVAWECLLVVQEVLVECTLGLRVFAMYGFNPWILATLLGTGALSASLAAACHLLIAMSSGPSLSMDVLKCSQPPVWRYATPPSCQNRLAAAWEAQLICDVVVFSLTLRSAYVQRRISGRFSGSLFERMVRDGAMYFGMIVLANLANLLTFYFGDILLAGFLSWFTTTLSVTLISRLMLNLHEAASIGIDTTEPNTIELESIRFPWMTLTVDAI
ncbi:hypothetical protein B0H10DRAFT_2188700 [Mycena sp. CBHHK59/15]|nr:hypothetical protein B0H10DRAFT_2188700 [Mycena sp. CBHHK59/15]